MLDVLVPSVLPASRRELEWWCSRYGAFAVACPWSLHEVERILVALVR